MIILAAMVVSVLISEINATDAPAMLPIFGKHARCSECGYQFTELATYTRQDDGSQFTVHHPGWDMNLSAPDDNGQSVFAIADGVVVDAETNPPDEWGSLVIEHTVNEQVFYSQYGHCQNVFVQTGELVKKGKRIALVGGVPNYAPHLHWEIRMPWPTHPNPTDRNYFNSSYLATLSNVTTSYRNPEPFVAQLNTEYRHLTNLNDRNPYGPLNSPIVEYGDYSSIDWWFGYDPNDLYNDTDGTARNCYLARLYGGSNGDGAIVYDALAGARHAYSVGGATWDMWLYMKDICDNPCPTTDCGNGQSGIDGGPRSALGMPITNAYEVGSGQWRQDFQKGYVLDGELNCYTAPGWTQNGWNYEHSYLFVDAYDRNGAARDVGEATETVVEDWNGTAYAVQHFSNDRMIVYDPQNFEDNPAATNEAYYIHGDFCHYYTTEPAVGPWILGAPTTDRLGNVQYFKSGRMEDDNGVIRAIDAEGDNFWNSDGSYHIFYDNFEDGNDDGWRGASYGTWTVTDGVYDVFLDTPESISWRLAGNWDWGDIHLSFNFNNTEGVEKLVYLRWGVGGTNGYLVRIRSNYGSFNQSNMMIQKYIDNTPVETHTYPVVTESNRWYRLDFLLADNTITCRLDGVGAFSYTDPENLYPNGRFGFAPNKPAGVGQSHVQFDNVRVYCASGATCLPFANVEGTVTDAGTSVALQGVLVELLQNSTVRYTTTTGANGHYEFVGIDAGDYDVTYSKVGYDSHSSLISLTENGENQLLTVNLVPHPESCDGFEGLFCDDFEDGNDDGWSILGTSPGGTWVVENGWYVYSNVANYHHSVAGDPEWTDYVFEFDVVRKTSGGDINIWTRAEAIDGVLTHSLYAVVLRSWDVVLLKYESGTGEVWRRNYPHNFDMGITYHVDISVIGDHIQVMINDVMVVDVTDVGTSLTTGMIALGGSYGVEVAFDNVKVWSVASPLLAETLELLPAEYLSQLEELSAVNQGSTTTLHQLTDPISQALKIILNWDGSELNLKAHKPDGTLYGEWQSDTPPIVADIISIDGGTWSYKVTAIDVPYDSYPFALVAGSLLLGSVSGTVADGSSGNGLEGVTVDLYSEVNELLGYNVTGQMGYYSFPDLIPGSYDITLINPLGFTADAESKSVTVVSGEDSVVNFALTALEIIPSQRSMGFWKHQVNVHLSGKGHAHISLEELSNYMNLISEHFNSNPTNPVTIFDVPQPAGQEDSLAAFQTLLTVNKDGTMNDRARQQITALLLNIVSGKLSQADASFSEDGATVSQAITYCNILITDSEPENDERAKEIAELINEGQVVPSGWIDPTTSNIAFKQIDNEQLPMAFSLSQNYPNPFNSQTIISYALPEVVHVRIDIYNLLGQKVKTLVNGAQEAGYRTVVWDGKSNQGSSVSSGIYFYKIVAGSVTESRKMILLE